MVICDYLLTLYPYSSNIIFKEDIKSIMKREKLSLQNKIDLIRKNLSNRDSFTISDVESILNEKKSTLYWTLWDLSQKGYIHKIGKGLYSLQEKKRDVNPALSPLSEKILPILRQSGYQFFISGLDILSIFMEHVPESYPVLLFVSNYSIEEVNDLLIKKNIATLIRPDIKNYQAFRQLPSVGELVLINHTNEFSYSSNGLASFEKAFVDLYYEVTRRQYPLAIQELVKIYNNMRRRISVNTNRLIKIASRKSIHYDIRYIVENKFISEKAKEFVKILKT